MYKGYFVDTINVVFFSADKIARGTSFSHYNSKKQYCSTVKLNNFVYQIHTR